uniref:Ig-like domain-containing protein n=1 Tax=Pyxicephalus adspersus TaxID=30357 RepID=A0AAV3AQP9_PYXAD|nr:TPA: hypothetical protein GDO54_009682 [Pyxicephalus adspersus]
MSQIPDYISVSPEQTITITCTLSRSLYRSIEYDHLLAWYQQKLDQLHKRFLYDASTRTPGISKRFSGSGSGTQLTMKVQGVSKDNEGKYYCQQSNQLPLTQ